MFFPFKQLPLLGHWLQREFLNEDKTVEEIDSGQKQVSTSSPAEVVHSAWLCLTEPLLLIKSVYN